MFEIFLRNTVKSRDKLQSPVYLFLNLWFKLIEEVKIIILVKKDAPYEIISPVAKLAN